MAISWIQAKVATATNPMFKLERSLRAKNRAYRRKIMIMQVEQNGDVHSWFKARRQLSYMVDRAPVRAQ